MNKKTGPKRMSYTRGFTLVELLVVISIIGFLSSTIIASINTARDKADNIYRVKVVEEYRKAFELARDDLSGYPWDASITGSSICLASTSCDNPPVLPSSNTVNTALAPYVTIQPAFKSFIVNHPLFGPAPLRGGPQYDCTQIVNGNPNLCARVSISYSMKVGTHCGLGATELNVPNGPYIWCALTFQ